MLRGLIGDSAEPYVERALGLPLEDGYRLVRAACDRVLAEAEAATMFRGNALPLRPREFLDSMDPEGKKFGIFPVLRDDFCELNHWVPDRRWGIRGRYNEAVLTGAIGSGKTTVAVWTTVYQTYLLLSLKDPHATLGMQPVDEIQMILLSAKEKLAYGVDYFRMRNLIEALPCFDGHPFDRTIKSEIRFLNNYVKIMPVATSELSALGQNVVGGIMDEINFLAVVEQSARSVEGGVYDQAVSLYNGISRRRKSRFMKKGWMPGMLCLTSSKKYGGEFTDTKIEEKEDDPEAPIFVTERRTWDVKPWDFGEERFRVFVGDEVKLPRVLGDDEEVGEDEAPFVVDVPTEFRGEFERDLYGCLRDIAGVGRRGKHPFIVDLQKLRAAFGRSESVFEVESVDLATQRVGIVPEALTEPDAPHWVHVDLAETRDCAGLAIGHVRRFVEVKRYDAVEGDEAEVWPEVVVDGVLQITPPVGGEIPLRRIRDVIYVLARYCTVEWVSADQYQSTDMLQMLQEQGFRTGRLSVDKDPEPYTWTKWALYEDRLLLPDHSACRREFERLVQVPKTGKVDHPPTGSKDTSDAVAAVLYGVSRQREVWAMHDVLGRQPAQRRYGDRPKDEQVESRWQ